MSIGEFVIRHTFKDVSSMEEGFQNDSNIKEHFGYPCTNGEDGLGSHEFMKWKLLMQDYVVDDTLNVKIYVKIKEMTGIKNKKRTGIKNKKRSGIRNKNLRKFDESNKQFSDLVLIVENQKFFVSKLFLANQSTYFNSRLSEISKKEEVTLIGIKADDLQNFLEVLYGELAIDDDTVDGIVHLADKYDTKTVRRQCESFLIDNSEKSMEEKFELVTKYNLEMLKSKYSHEKISNMTGTKNKNLRRFDKSNKPFSDVTLVVKKQKFYVSKLFLANQSTYFNSLLSGNFEESKKEKVTLHDIEPEDFQNFLEVLYEEPAINDDTVTGIIHLANEYDTKTVLRQCQEFLMEASEKSLKEKLGLAIKYNIENLKNECLLEIKTIDDIRSVLPGDLIQLDHTIMASLLQKAVSLRVE